MAEATGLTKDDLSELLEDQSELVLSIYLPTNRVAVEPEENSLHLKNLVREAGRKLDEHAIRRPEADRLLEPIVALLEDKEAWRSMAEGLALFRTEQFRVFRIPYQVPEEILLGPAPYTKHLYRAIFPEVALYILAVSQHTIRLYRAGRHWIEEIDLSGLDIPRTLEEALRYDDLQKPELQHHPTTGPGRGPVGQADVGGGERRHGFHGHGESGEGQKIQIRRYLQAVDAGIAKLLDPVRKVPVVLAGVEYIRAIYREVSELAVISDEAIEGSPDRRSAADLHRAAASIIEGLVESIVNRARDRYGTLSSRGLATDDLDEVVAAAHDGRVDTLFALPEAPEWGLYDAAERTTVRHAEPQPGDVDLIDLAARQTFTHAGAVYILDQPEIVGVGPAAAILRY